MFPNQQASSSIVFDASSVQTAYCPIAKIYHEYKAGLLEAASAHLGCLQRNRRRYGFHLSMMTGRLPEDAGAFPQDVFAAWEEIEASANRLAMINAMRNEVLTVVCAAQMAEIGKSMRSRDDEVGELAVEAMKSLRHWRIFRLDGVDMDLVALADAEAPWSPSDSSFFGRLFKAWVEGANTGMHVKAARAELMAYIASTTPELAPCYMARNFSMNPNAGLRRPAFNPEPSVGRIEHVSFEVA